LKSCKSDFSKRLQTNYKNLILTSIYVHDDSNLENVGNCFAEVTMKSRFVRPNDRLAEAMSSREALTLKSIDRPSKGEPDSRTRCLYLRSRPLGPAVNIIHGFHAYVSPNVFSWTRL